MTTIATIISTVATYYDIPREWIVTARHTRGAAGHARRVAMFLADVHAPQNCTDIGRAFRKDRSTVRHAVDKIKKSGDARIAGEVAAIERRLFPLD